MENDMPMTIRRSKSKLPAVPMTPF